MGKKKRNDDLIRDYYKYKDIPEDRDERMEYLYTELKIKDKEKNEIEQLSRDILYNKRKNRKFIKMVFYVVPEGIARPRLGFGRRFYVPNIQKFYDYMEWYVEQHNINEFIYSECAYDIKYYLPLPSDMTKKEKILAEMKIIRCAKKPDWDNLGKGTDMFHKILLDDSLTTDVRIRKRYSIKPRIEVKITYYTEPTNSYHLKSLKKMKRWEEYLNGEIK